MIALHSRPLGPAPAPTPPAEDLEGLLGESGWEGPAPPVRTRRRQKTVLLIDDDEAARHAAQAALDEAQVPVHTAADGNAAIAAIAAEKPDVVALELGLGGSMAGKDVINMIKATMEWVDIPIILYTRIVIESEKEATTLHGADALIRKGPGAEAGLVARVIHFFQRA